MNRTHTGVIPIPLNLNKICHLKPRQNLFHTGYILYGIYLKEKAGTRHSICKPIQVLHHPTSAQSFLICTIVVWNLLAFSAKPCFFLSNNSCLLISPGGGNKWCWKGKTDCTKGIITLPEFIFLEAIFLDGFADGRNYSLHAQFHVQKRSKRNTDKIVDSDLVPFG